MQGCSEHGGLGLAEEPLAAHRVVGVAFADLLERDDAVQLDVADLEDPAQAAAGEGLWVQRK